MSSGVERCRVWNLDTDERGTSLDNGVEGCRGVSRGVRRVSSWHGVSRCRVGVEVYGVEVSRSRGQGSQPINFYQHAPVRRRAQELRCSNLFTLSYGTVG